MIPRFHVSAELVAGAVIDLPAAIAHHALRVLRLRDSAAVVLFNGRGGECSGVLQIAGRGARVVLERCSAIERESPLAVTLLQAWIAGDKLDWVIEKGTELGAVRFVLAPAERSVVRLAGTRRTQRVERLRQIAIAACCQCGRNRVPTILAAESLEAALAAAREGAAAAWLLDPAAPQAARPPLHAASLALAIGPEGGWSDAERALASGAGWATFALGPRILRTESAGPAALAAVQALAGDLR
jgi:16S rRNA (uracil1498-N3)-methyltransferase